MRFPLERKLSLGFGAAALVLLLVSGAAIWNLRWLQATYYWVDHTHDTLRGIGEVTTDALSMQTSTRGYVLTGNEEVLQPYRESDARMSATFARLLQLLVENPAQLERLQRLRQLVGEARQVMEERIATRRTRGLEATTDAPAFLRGQTAVQNVRRLAAEMEREERRLLEDRFRRSRLAAKSTLFTILGATIVALAMVIFAGKLVRRDLARRQRAERERDRFFTVTRDLLCLAGFDGYFKRVNPAWTATLGFEERDLLTEPFMSFVHPEDRAATTDVAARLGNGEEIVSFENRYRCRDGSYRWILWNARSLVAEQLIIASGRDITERKQADVHIQQLNRDLESRARELETANRELESFSYSVSHDLRAPLRHIDGFSNLLSKRATNLDAESQRYLSVISRAAKQMGMLIDDLLAFSRIGRSPLRRERVPQDLLVASVIAEGRYGSSGPRITWEIASLPDVRADSAMLRQVWANLLDNAVKYSSKTAEPRISIGSSRDSLTGHPAFFVRDNGVGFDMAYADKLFGVFQRLHDSADFEGTGIGLANVHRIVSRHGGRIWAEARPGEGAVFYFSLPSETDLSEPRFSS